MNVKTNIMEKEQKKKLEEFLLTADELKKWLTDNTGKIYYKPKAEVEAVYRKFDGLKGAEQPSGNLDGLYLYKHINDNGITVSLKTSSEGETMEIVGLSPRQRNVLGAIIECFAKE